MKTAKVTRILHSQGLHKAKFDRLTRIAALCGRVRADAWQRCSGLSTAQQSAYEIRNAWMAEGYDWYGLPARLGKATLADALGDIQAGREAAKVSVKKAIWHRTRGNGEERHRLYSLLKRNRWDEDSFLHRQMRKQWQGGTSRVTNQIVADSGSYTAKVWHGRAWVYLQGLEHGQRIAIPLRGMHLPTGTLRIILQDDGQVAIHYAVDEDTACSTKPCGTAKAWATCWPRRAMPARSRADGATICVRSSRSTARPDASRKPTTSAATTLATRSGTAGRRSIRRRRVTSSATPPTASSTAPAPSPARI